MSYLLRSLFLTVFLAYPALGKGVDCDCHVMVYSPLSTKVSISPIKLKTFQLDRYGFETTENQISCRKSCLTKFKREIKFDRLQALLALHSQELIEKNIIGFNCTGLTTLKFPVRVKAVLGDSGLGNVVDHLVIINHEEKCF